MADPTRIVRAWLESPTTGIIELEKDWTDTKPPRFTLGAEQPALLKLSPAPGLAAGRVYGYFFDSLAGEMVFVLPLQHGCDIDPARDTVYLAGDFNGWQEAVGKTDWLMLPEEIEGERVLAWRGDAEGAGVWEIALDQNLHGW
ncbi:MAG TPA: hypothetical protein VGE76_09185, partial [Opitutaceae bacterium]